MSNKIFPEQTHTEIPFPCPSNVPDNIPVTSKLHVALDYTVDDKEAEKARDFLAGDTEAFVVEIENDKAKVTIRFERIMD